jgi:L-cysteate sulfo-lyase
VPADPLALGHFPTPLRELRRLRGHLNARSRLWIKHDDWSGPGFGGNKVRKLEYVLAEALSRECDTVLTTGGVRSNHCRVTAAVAANLGLECHLVLNGEAPEPEPASYFLDQLYGAKLHYVERGCDRQPALLRLALELESQGRRPFMIPLGASTPLGALGFMRGAGELLHQTRELGFEPDWIVHATSSGGTQAGMLAGLMRHGAATRVLGVSADETAADLEAIIRKILDGLTDLLGEPIPPPGLEIDDTHVGAGYGIPTAEAEDATRLLARLEGVVLDPVYTAKAMAGLLAALETGRFDAAGHVVFWHTGGQMAMFSAP